MLRVAVIMSVYEGDTAHYLEMACESILGSDYSGVHLYIAVDGPVKRDVSDYLLRLSRNRQDVFLSLAEENRGLAFRLNELIDKVLKDDSVAYLARMDSDDISYPNRLSRQVEFLESNPDIGVLGTSLIEIDDNGIELHTKTMPEEHLELKDNIVYRCPFNHPTVMFRRSVFDDGSIRYDSSLKNTQDYYLWVDLLSRGIRFANLSEPLLFFRISDGFYARRGWAKAMNDFRARIHAMNTLNCYTTKNFFYAIALFLLRISPRGVKCLAYKKLR